MLHLMKLAVGIRDIAHLRDVQAARGRADPPLRHRTRHHPRRAEAVLDGGSIYWVIGGILQVRQAVGDIVADTMEDGSACAALVLDPTLVAVLPRPTRPFQGWRYLAADSAPPDAPDLDGPDATHPDAMPPDLVHALRVLCLL
jgi:hypothetical protein